MNAAKFSNKMQKVLALSDAALWDEYVAAGYSRVVNTCLRATPQGHLEIIKLTPNDPTRLAFSVRRDQDAVNDIDVDAYGEEKQVRNFKAGRKGYSGHKVELEAVAPRVFHVSIDVPEGKVYEARFSCGTHWGVCVDATMGGSPETLESEPAKDPALESPARRE